MNPAPTPHNGQPPQPTNQQLQEWRDRHGFDGMCMTDLRCAYDDAASEATLSLRAQLKDMTDQFLAVSGQLGEARSAAKEYVEKTDPILRDMEDLSDQLARLRADNKVLRELLVAADKEREELIDGICQAEQMISEAIDKHLDEDPPEGSMGRPLHAELREIQAHLSGTCIGRDGEYLARDKFRAYLARSDSPGARKEGEA